MHFRPRHARRRAGPWACVHARAIRRYELLWCDQSPRPVIWQCLPSQGRICPEQGLG